jgi:CheY-like chemotaxis protein
MTKILLVEDDKSLREIYGVRLLAEGYDIVSAGDGEEALAMAIKEKPQLIISDVMMPKISGFDMLDILRSTTETRDIKVIMMTALSSDDQRARGEQLGADKYLVKSQVGIEDVVRTVHEVLEDKAGASAPAVAPADAPAPAAEEAAPAEPATEPEAEPAPAAPAEDPAVASSTSPGNDGAGPLPPQPSEVKPLEETKPAESSLPQPTAPFSSPRPANLGEDAVKPEESAPAPEAPAAEPADEKDTELTSSGLGFEEKSAGSAPVVGAPSPSVEPASSITPPEPAPEAPAAEEQSPDSASTPPAAPAA